MLEKRNVHGGYKRNTKNKRLTWICIAHLFFIQFVFNQVYVMRKKTRLFEKKNSWSNSMSPFVEGVTFYWSKLNLLNRTCLIRNRNCLPFASTWLHPWLSEGVCVAQRFSFLLVVFLNTIPRGRNCWHFTSTWVHSLFFCEVCITNLFFSELCLLFCLSSFRVLNQMLPVSDLSILDCPLGYL